MEFVLYSLWQVDVKNLVQNKLFICKEYHVQPSEIDRMVFFEYEYILEYIRKEQKEQKKRQEEDEKKYGNMNIPNYSSMMSAASKNIPSMPKISMPKL